MGAGQPGSGRYTASVAWVLGCVAWAGPVRADEASEAFARLRASDDLLARGRVGQAYSGYLDLERRYPTWWAPVLKAGIAARALGLAIGTTAVDRAGSLASGEPFVAFVRALTALEVSGGGDAAGPEPGAGADLAPTDLAVRLAMARGKRAEQRGDRDAALREYGWIANRCPRCVAAVWRLMVLGGGSDRDAPASLFPPRSQRARGIERPGEHGSREPGNRK